MLNLGIGGEFSDSKIRENTRKFVTVGFAIAFCHGLRGRAAVPSVLNVKPHTRVAKPREPFPTCFAVLLMNYS